MGETNCGAQFTFNCYRHWATLVVRNTSDSSGHFLHRNENVNHGDSLAMIAYGIGVLPLTKSVCRDCNGKTGPAWRCSGKRYPPPQTNPPPPTQPPTPPTPSPPPASTPH